jgi:secreted trypsin-like serine protease
MTVTARPLQFRCVLLLLCLQLLVESRTVAEQRQHVRIRDLQAEDEAIVGGSQADKGEFPAFTLFGNGECGAVLISEDRALTSASCVHTGHPHTVRVGVYRREDGGKNVGVKCAKSHPNYKWPDFQYDIAVLKLEKSITALPFPFLNTNPSYPNTDGTRLIAVGMGRDTTKGEVASKLMKLNYTYVSDEDCKETYGDAVSKGLSICAKGKDQGTCFGDSGGPLFDNDGILIGIVSGSKDGCADNTNAVFRVNFWSKTVNMTYLLVPLPFLH